MRVPNHVRPGSVGFNMTPMIDVVFLLIIFFLVSSHLARRENQIELPLPVADSGEDNWDDEAPRVTLNVTGDGSVLLAARPVGPEQLAGRLRQAYEKMGHDLELRIRADRGVAYRFISPILASAARADIWNVTFAVVSRKDAG